MPNPKTLADLNLPEIPSEAVRLALGRAQGESVLRDLTLGRASLLVLFTRRDFVPGRAGQEVKVGEVKLGYSLRDIEGEFLGKIEEERFYPRGIVRLSQEGTEDEDRTERGEGSSRRGDGSEAAPASAPQGERDRGGEAAAQRAPDGVAEPGDPGEDAGSRGGDGEAGERAGREAAEVAEALRGMTRGDRRTFLEALRCGYPFHQGGSCQRGVCWSCQRPGFTMSDADLMVETCEVAVLEILHCEVVHNSAYGLIQDARRRLGLSTG